MKTLISYQSQVIDHLGLAAGTYENFIVISGLKWVVEAWQKATLKYSRIWELINSLNYQMLLSNQVWDEPNPYASTSNIWFSDSRVHGNPRTPDYSD